jgi:hypothetical protein
MLYIIYDKNIIYSFLGGSCPLEPFLKRKPRERTKMVTLLLTRNITGYARLTRNYKFMQKRDQKKFNQRTFFKKRFIKNEIKKLSENEIKTIICKTNVGFYLQIY